MDASLLNKVVGRIQEFGVADVVGLVFVSWLFYWVGVGVYRVYFHPLAKFPGPKVLHISFPFSDDFCNACGCVTNFSVVGSIYILV